MTPAFRLCFYNTNKVHHSFKRNKKPVAGNHTEKEIDGLCEQEEHTALSKI